MLKKLHIAISSSTDPYCNLNGEEQLLHRCDSETMILYLWQNANTVVIGRNQSAYRECRTELLAEEGGHLARRLSGGGAVYHDLGNLNFTFVTWRLNYDLKRQMHVIQQALADKGIEAAASGRNDILVQGRKCSGNAFYLTQEASYHHGTLMVNVDADKVMRYLKPDDEKLQANGVKSIRSRIINLQEVCPSLSVDELKAALIEAAEKEYGLKAEIETIHSERGRYADADWLYRNEIEHGYQVSERYPFGRITINADMREGYIHNVGIFSDAMEVDFCAEAERMIQGNSVQRAIELLNASSAEHAQEIVSLLKCLL